MRRYGEQGGAEVDGVPAGSTQQVADATGRVDAEEVKRRVLAQLELDGALDVLGAGAVSSTAR